MTKAAETHQHADMSDPARWEQMIAFYEEQAHPFTSMFAEDALAPHDIGPATRLLDVATGMGAAAFAAARRGARVTAIDFAAGMVDRVHAAGLANVEALQMDGQALDLPDATFDISVSIFGAVLFPDWHAGLSEMARVTRPGGTAIVATWRNPNGAGTNLLLWEVRQRLFPDLPPPPRIGGLSELCEPDRLAAAMVEAGFVAPKVRAATHDFQLKLATLDDADRLLSLIPAWADMDSDARDLMLGEMMRRAGEARVGDHMPIPSTALIATARKV
ncbi:class I SAM-dependent methyltransferase [Sphingosinicella rhizophila]|uniref:Methyltransferase domain-containing protein n=1 Tax=Sphingosinicella rhizophila TaxID=3050082 RepID=A0ABU3QB76_9SPHN|nr:methyltransferase domain-containing protein [Sphingosinicella sp. GR2756]MDT9600654.1 methyltransferase domain-containing protein [Sphingosinicella sp. GR2756]